MSQAGKRAAPRQLLHGLGIVDVPPLREVGEEEVVLDQELHGGRVVGVEVEPPRHRLDERHALGRVPVPERLADVMEEDAEHEELRPFHLGEDLRELVGLGALPGAEAFQYLHRQERVLVDGKPVVVIVLDETVQRTELREVGAEHPGVVHPPEGGRHAPPRTEDREEEVLQLGRRPPGLRGERWRGLLEGPLELDAELAPELLRVPEDPQDPGGFCLEDARLREVEPAGVDDQPVGEGRAAPAPPDRAVTGEPFLAARDQPRRDAVDRAGVPIVIAHERLGAEPHLVVLVSEAFGHRDLEPALQHVLLGPGQEVELVANAPEEGEGRVGRRPLLGGQESLVLQLPERARPEAGGGEPQRRVDVPQPAGRFFDVRLLEVDRTAVPAVALVPLREHPGEKLGVVAAVDLAPERPLERAEEPLLAGEHARGLHRGAARQVRPREGQAVVEGAAGVADAEPEIPEGVEDLLGHALDVRRHLAPVDQHEVEVGGGVELAPAVSAERHEHER